jgi:hypothetical protein
MHLIKVNNGLIVIFIPVTNLNDTRTVFDNQATNLLWLRFVHKW